jgi:hypothetical protein
MADDECIRIKIAKDWTASSLSEFLSDLQFLYGLDLSLEAAHFYYPFQTFGYRYRPPGYETYPSAIELALESHYVRLNLQTRIKEKLANDSELKLARIEHASPGFMDIAGMGKIVEQIRIFITDIIDRRLHQEDVKIAREAARQDMLAKKIANIDNFMKLNNKGNLPYELQLALQKEMFDLESAIEARVISGQVTAVENQRDQAP